MARTVSLCIEEGQMVWFHSQARYISSEYVKVIEVGNLWAVLGNGFKANRYTGVCEGRGYERPPGFIYCTREDWEKERALYNTWSALRREIANLHELPEGMTRRQLLNIRRLLKIGE